MTPTPLCHWSRQLAKDQQELAKVFKLERLLAGVHSGEDVKRYYRASSLLYKLFHSRAGAIHMALAAEGDSDAEPTFDAQVERVSRLVRPEDRVLEVACGKAFNLSKLAISHPNSEFFGVDITPTNVRVAIKRCKRLANVRIRLADFDRLPPEIDRLDAIYGIEGLCHSTDLAQTALSLSRRLVNGGALVIIDGFRTTHPEPLPESVERSIKLTERSMALSRMWSADEWTRALAHEGVVLETTTDLTAAVQPQLAKLRRRTQRFLARPRIARLIAWGWPHRGPENAVAGLLLAPLVEAGVCEYRELVYRKVGDTLRP